MLHFLFPPTLLLIIAPAADQVRRSEMRVQFGQMTFHQRIIIRVPRMPRPRDVDRASALPAVEWDEKKGPKCVALDTIAAATLTRPESIDLLVQDGTRLRAHFADDCPAIDFYGGVYMKASIDGQLCAKRDVVRARSGRQCPIRSFKRVVQKR